MARIAAIALAVLAVGCTRFFERSSDDGAVAPAAAIAAPASTAVEAPAIVVAPFGPPAVEVPSEPLRVLVGGDLIPHRPSLAAPSSILSALTPLTPVFKQADAVVANYEAATGELSKKAFRAPAGRHHGGHRREQPRLRPRARRRRSDPPGRVEERAWRPWWRFGGRSLGAAHARRT